jgi:16S rRNA (guanine966-N2)-methyltransferase
MGLIITGGSLRGRKLSTDPRSTHIRPTSGKVREALFSSLGERVVESRFVDLFAGSGSVGFEALSRGAADVFLVENHPKSWALLKGNRDALVGQGPDAARVHLEHASAAAFCRRCVEAGETFSLIFADPPFDSDFSALPRLIAPILAPEGTFVVQYPSRNQPTWVKAAGKIKTYGESGVAFFEADNQGPQGRSIF